VAVAVVEMENPLDECLSDVDHEKSGTKDLMKHRQKNGSEKGVIFYNLSAFLMRHFRAASPMVFCHSVLS
jgi:hypothetical protein